MISVQKVKKLVMDESGKKIGKKAVEKLDFILEDIAKRLIKQASQNADFYGRVVIKAEDVES